MGIVFYFVYCNVLYCIVLYCISDIALSTVIIVFIGFVPFLFFLCFLFLFLKSSLSNFFISSLSSYACCISSPVTSGVCSFTRFFLVPGPKHMYLWLPTILILVACARMHVMQANLCSG